MTTRQTRRGFLRTVAVGGAASLLGSRQGLTAEAMPETDTVRLTKVPGICVAPQYIEELLRAEGFRDVRYIETPAGILPVGKVDPIARMTAVGFGPIAEKISALARSEHAAHWACLMAGQWDDGFTLSRGIRCQ